MAENEFTHVGITRETQKKIAILAKIYSSKIYEIVASWADREWERALNAELVTDAMLVQVEGEKVLE